MPDLQAGVRSQDVLRPLLPSALPRQGQGDGERQRTQSLCPVGGEGSPLRGEDAGLPRLPAPGAGDLPGRPRDGRLALPRRQGRVLRAKVRSAPPVRKPHVPAGLPPGEARPGGGRGRGELQEVRGRMSEGEA